ncbi:hypothetical protein GCM10010968_16340 [Agrococcus terreus]|uniref:Uncharacterized protein n=1 Tax=Agrococcus terreus TaxID=574649 RepID=A0ABQ2KK89_9MICO|nr:hypothetical protein GCM10010968_16340 [Agrococcus terreus]
MVPTATVFGRLIIGADGDVESAVVDTPSILVPMGGLGRTRRASVAAKDRLEPWIAS